MSDSKSLVEIDPENLAALPFSRVLVCPLEICLTVIGTNNSRHKSSYRFNPKGCKGRGLVPSKNQLAPTLRR
jgi:hypothetical protein